MPGARVQLGVRGWKDSGDCVLDQLTEAEVALLLGSGFVKANTFDFMLDGGRPSPAVFSRGRFSGST